MPPVKPKGAERLALINSLTIDALAHSDGTILSLWAAEDADLVNPYHEDPTPLFAYEADPINEEVWLRAEPAARAARALAAAEEVLGINREPLRRVRYSQYAALVLAKTAWSSTDDELHALATTMLKRLQHPSQPFAGMSRWYARAWGLSLA